MTSTSSSNQCKSESEYRNLIFIIFIQMTSSNDESANTYMYYIMVGFSRQELDSISEAYAPCQTADSRKMEIETMIYTIFEQVLRKNHFESYLTVFYTAQKRTAFQLTRWLSFWTKSNAIQGWTKYCTLTTTREESWKSFKGIREKYIRHPLHYLKTIYVKKGSPFDSPPTYFLKRKSEKSFTLSVMKRIPKKCRNSWYQRRVWSATSCLTRMHQSF